MDVNQLFDMLDQIPVNDYNIDIIEDTRKAIEEGDYQLAIEKINQLYNTNYEENDNQEIYEAEQEGYSNEFRRRTTRWQ